MSDPVAVPAASTPRLGAFARLVQVFFSPGAVFDDIVRKPTIVAVLVALIISTVGAQLIVVPKLDLEAGLRKQFAHSTRMSEDDKEKAVRMAGKFKWIAPAVTVIAFPMQFAMLAGFYFLALKLMGSESNDFIRLFSGVAHAFWPPTLVKIVLTMAVSLSRTRIDMMEAQHLVRSSVGAFMPATAPRALIAVGDCFDVLDFWKLALVALALSKIGRVPLAKAAGIAIGFWVAISVLFVAMATLQGLAENIR